jgi:hypothetical protein
MVATTRRSIVVASGGSHHTGNALFFKVLIRRRIEFADDRLIIAACLTWKLNRPASILCAKALRQFVQQRPSLASRAIFARRLTTPRALLARVPAGTQTTSCPSPLFPEYGNPESRVIVHARNQLFPGRGATVKSDLGEFAEVVMSEAFRSSNSALVTWSKGEVESPAGLASGPFVAGSTPEARSRLDRESTGSELRELKPL